MLVTHFKLRSSESEVSVQFLFDKNMQDWKYLHTVSWIGQYPCITMNESMLVSSNHSHCQLSPVCERARYCVEDERVIFKSSVTQSLHFISQTLHILLVMHLSSKIFFKNLQVFIFKYLWKIHQFRQAKRHSQSYHTKAEASSSMRPHFEQKPEEAPFNDKTTATSASSDKQQQQSSTARSQILAEIVFPKVPFFSPNQITCIFLKIIGSWSNHSKRESNCGECSSTKSRASVKSEIAKAYANSNLTKNFPSHIVSLT